MRWWDGHEFEQTLGDTGRQGNLACCSPWGSQSRIQQLNKNSPSKVGLSLSILVHYIEQHIHVSPFSYTLKATKS